MTVTEKWLRSNMNGGIGITAKQLKALGLPCPPQKGWLKNTLGKEITEKQAKAFENGKKNNNKDTVRPDSDKVSSRGMSFDVSEIYSLTKNISAGKFKDTPLAKYGYLNVRQNICAVCGISLKSVVREDFRNNIQLVSVCEDCIPRLDGETVTRDAATTGTAGEEDKSLKERVIPVHNLTFDDMRLCPIQPAA